MRYANLSLLVLGVLLLADRPLLAKKAAAQAKAKAVDATETVKEAPKAAKAPESEARASTAETTKTAKVSEGRLDGKVEQMAVCGTDFSHIMVLTDRKDLFHTTNFGGDWASKRSEVDAKHSARKLQIVSMFQDNMDHNKVILFDRTGEHLVTTDCGLTYDRLAPAPLNLTSVFFHPLNSSVLAGLDANRSLHVTRDGGKVWTKVADNILDFNFAKYSENAYFSSKDRIFALRESLRKDKSLGADLVYSDDFLQTSTVILGEVEQFVLTRCCVYAKQTGSEWKVAEAFGWGYTFYVTAIFDRDLRHIDNLRVLDNDVTWYPMTALEYHKNGLELNKLGKGDFWSSKFEVLEQNLVCQKQVGTCDFIPLHILSGVMVLNRYDPEYTAYRVELPKFLWQSMDPILDFESLSDFRQTLISFNFGEKFQPIPVPAKDHNGNPMDCDGCALHLHLFSSKRTFSLPKANLEAPGVIVASGSVGKYLAEEEDGSAKIGVFVSENAGFDWRMIAAGNWVFEVLDRGSVLLMAEARTNVTSLRYSLDMGRTFGELKIAGEPLEVISISANEKQFLRKAVVVGRRRTPRGFDNRLLTVDFSSIVERECVYDKEDAARSDYVEWTPFSDASNRCWNGREVVLTIKKPTAKCFNPLKYVNWYTKRYCPCTEADFHCDFGFERNDRNECVKVDALAADEAPPALCKGTYFKPSGYKKNLESFCYGGVEHPYEEVSCPRGILSVLYGIVWRLLKWGVVLAGIYFALNAGLLGSVLELKEKIERRLRSIRQARVWKSKEYCELKKNDMGVEPPRRASGYSEVKKDVNSIFEEEDEEGAVQMSG